MRQMVARYENTIEKGKTDGKSVNVTEINKDGRAKVRVWDAGRVSCALCEAEYKAKSAWMANYKKRLLNKCFACALLNATRASAKNQTTAEFWIEFLNALRIETAFDCENGLALTAMCDVYREDAGELPIFE
jgi:hypothetical protein